MENKADLQQHRGGGDGGRSDGVKMESVQAGDGGVGAGKMLGGHGG